MAKTGRNDLCHCGSGKKYKRCCLEKDEAAASAALTATRAQPDVLALGGHQHRCPCCGGKAFSAGFVSAEDAELLDDMSNVVGDLIRAGKLDEAERSAHALLERFPQVHDGYDRLGMVCEARGDSKRAAHYYRKVVAFARQHQDDYDPEFIVEFQDRADRLDPVGA